MLPMGAELPENCQSKWRGTERRIRFFRFMCGGGFQSWSLMSGEAARQTDSYVDQRGRDGGRKGEVGVRWTG